MDKPRRKWDWIGLVVRTKVSMMNGEVWIPDGTEMVVIYQQGGADLVAKPCAHCGIAKRSIRKVPLDELEPIRRAFPAPPFRSVPPSISEAIRVTWPEVSNG